MARGLLVVALAGACLPAYSHAVEITNVFAEPMFFDPRKNGSTEVHFRLSDAAHIELAIYDGRNLRIALVKSKGVLAAGGHALIWDGHDSNGRAAPPEAYHYVLSAPSARASGAVVWDVTDTTGGNKLSPTRISWDAAARVVRYDLAQSARVRIRIGLANGGPLLRTLIDWVARPAGSHAEPWDGWDQDRLIDLSEHPNRSLSVEAFALPRNTVSIGPVSNSVDLISELPQPATRRAITSTAPKRMYDYARQEIEGRRDFSASLSLPADLHRDSAGLPIVSGPIPIKLDVAPEDRIAIIDERFESVFFLDGMFLFENEVGFLPMTWTWDPAGANPGVHYLSVNLRGYEGHFGMATVRLVVADAATKTSTRGDE